MNTWHREHMNEQRLLLTKWLATYARLNVPFVKGRITHALAAVAGWVRDYDAGNATLARFFELDNEISSAMMEAYDNLPQFREQREHEASISLLQDSLIETITECILSRQPGITVGDAHLSATIHVLSMTDERLIAVCMRSMLSNDDAA